MKSALNNVNSWVGGIVGLLKTVIVFFVFVNILYVTNVNPIGGIIELVDSFVNGGLAGAYNRRRAKCVAGYHQSASLSNFSRP